MPTTHAICHYCGLSCGVKAEIEDANGRRRLVSLIGDKDNPAYHGYTCAKGRDLPVLLDRHGGLEGICRGESALGPGRGFDQMNVQVQRTGVSRRHFDGSL